MALSILAISSPAPAMGEPAKGADSFVDSIGVNIHTTFWDTAYSRFDLVKQKLSELGVRHIRDHLITAQPNQYKALNDLAASGIKANLIMEDPDRGKGVLDELLTILRTQVRGATESVEGPNEWDNKGNQNWLDELGDYQQQLHAAVKSDPALSSLPVVGPSLVQWESYEQLGDISNLLDYGNTHSYPDGYFPESSLASYLDYAAKVSSAKPQIATETGYHNALNWQGAHNAASEQAAAVYMPRVYLEYFRRGVARTYAYELVDEFPDPNQNARESNFGLLRNDFSEKPAFVAIRNLIEILADPGAAFQPGSLNYSLGGDLSDLHQVLLGKRDGTFYLALWRESSVWDPVKRHALDPPAKPVTLAYGQPIARADSYLPGVSAAPIVSVVSHPDPIAPLDVMVGAEVVIVRLVPASAQAGSTSSGTIAGEPPLRIRFWAAKRSIRAGERLAVGGRVSRRGRSMRVAIQSRQGRWKTIERTRTSKGGAFRQKLRLASAHRNRVIPLRVLAGGTGRSLAIRVRVRR